MKLKNFYKAKDTVNRIKQQSKEWEKFFTSTTPDRGLISKIYKELRKLNAKTFKIFHFKKCGTDLNREFSIKDSHIAKKHLK